MLYCRRRTQDKSIGEIVFMAEENSKIEIGKKLRNARVSMGYTLDDLQKATKIQKRYLIAIEDENFNELPGDFYVRAFVKQYADTVQLNGDELLRDYDDELPKSKSTEYSEHMSRAIETRAGQTRKNTDSLDRVRQYLPTIIIAVVILVILGVIWLTALHGRSSSSDNNNIDSSSVSVSGESSQKSSQTSSKNSSSTKESTSSKSSKLSLNATSQTSSAAVFTVKGASSSDLKLKITPTKRAWISVTTDGTSQLSQTLSANESQTVKISSSAKKVVISLGNAQYTTLKLNGKTINATKDNEYPNVSKVTLNLNGSTSSTTSSSSSSVGSSSAGSSSSTQSN